MSPLGLRLERAKAADREAISGALQKLKKIDAYMAAGAEEKMLGGVYPGVTHWSQVRRVLWCIYFIVVANPEGSAGSAHPRVYIPKGCLRPPQD